MSIHRLCEEPIVNSCPELFRIQASKWIDSSNFGDHTVLTPPPSGIRLRWNNPFLNTDPIKRIGLPKTYSVFRSNSLSDYEFTDFQPNAGHLPRCQTLKKLWRKLGSINNNRVYDLRNWEDTSACDSVDAIYIEFTNPATPPVVVSLIGTDGKTSVRGTLKGGDKFYFEEAGISRVEFSADPGNVEVFGMKLSFNLDLDITFNKIAEIDAGFWTDNSLEDVSMRLANEDGNPFITVNSNDWDALRDVSLRVRKAYQKNEKVEQNDINALRLATNINLEVAALVGLSFIDGEHPANTGPDTFINMLSDVDGNDYCYYVSAEIENTDGSTYNVDSTFYFTKNETMNQLANVSAKILPKPITRMELTNIVKPSEGNINHIREETEKTFCTAKWKLSSSLPNTEMMISTPVAEKSKITGETVDSEGEFYSGANPKIIQFEGLTFFEERVHSFPVPYFDSDIWLDLVASDNWGRRKKLPKTDPIQPDIEYKGNCIPLSEGNCENEIGEVSLNLDLTQNWKADRLASNSGGKISLLIKDPFKEILVYKCEIGPANPSADGSWAGIITGLKENENEFYRLIGGTLLVGGFTAQILGVVPDETGKIICHFEAVTECAVTSIYTTNPSGTIAASLEEDTNSSNLWLEVTTEVKSGGKTKLELVALPLLPDGKPSASAIKLKLSDIENVISRSFDRSMTLYFATRLIFDFEGNPYKGIISTPIPVTYIHLIKAPEICFNIEQIGNDYYNRGIVRAIVDQCPRLNEKYASILTIAPSKEIDPAKFAEVNSQGLFGAQTPINNRTILEVFSTIDAFVESATGGINYCNELDGVESKSKLEHFCVRRVDD